MADFSDLAGASGCSVVAGAGDAQVGVLTHAKTGQGTLGGGRDKQTISGAMSRSPRGATQSPLCGGDAPYKLGVFVMAWWCGVVDAMLR